MFTVEFTVFKETRQVSFATHAEASRFVRECLKKRTVKARLVTKLDVPALKMGGYARLNALRPVHNTIG